jgi:hypothetical protein
LDFEGSFVLPEKWCIKRTVENCEVINDYLNKKYDYQAYFSKHGYIYSQPINGTSLGSMGDEIIFGFTEITFEQFKQYVMGGKSERKIIGYKCPMDIFGKKVKAGDLFKLTQDTTQYYHEKHTNSCRLPKEIVETWEPVYEEPKPKFKVGDWVVVLEDASLLS